VKISVMQQMKTNELPQPFAIFIVKNPHAFIPQRLTELKQEDIVYSTGSPRYEKTLHVYANNMKPGLYVVLIATYLTGMEGNFQLNILTNYRCDVTAIWPPAWMLREEGGKNNAQSSMIATLGNNVKAKAKVKGAVDSFTKLFKAFTGGKHDNFDDDDEEEDEEEGGEGGEGNEENKPTEEAV